MKGACIFFCILEFTGECGMKMQIGVCCEYMGILFCESKNERICVSVGGVYCVWVPPSFVFQIFLCVAHTKKEKWRVWCLYL